MSWLIFISFWCFYRIGNDEQDLEGLEIGGKSSSAESLRDDAELVAVNDPFITTDYMVFTYFLP